MERMEVQRAIDRQPSRKQMPALLGEAAVGLIPLVALCDHFWLLACRARFLRDG
jgi:hypothetical protein